VVSCTGEGGGVLKTEGGHELYEGWERHDWGRGRESYKRRWMGLEEESGTVKAKNKGRGRMMATWALANRRRDCAGECNGNEQQLMRMKMGGQEGDGKGDKGGEGGDEDNRRKEEETKVARWWRCNLRSFFWVDDSSRSCSERG